ncbi:MULTISPECIES: sirohydrochlorin chelatase [unclassified Streptomyces]|uniref:sirohydrochlorin chelatase n=1 Tax=unclassified Streptomyces TaxID=2593676 RepID=UPI0036F0A61F
MSDRFRVIAVCGHEAAHGAALQGLVDSAVTVVPSGRALYRCVAGLRRGGEKGCVVPMTLGRDPELVAETARTLRALPAAERPGTVLAEPFGTSQHLIGWLRAAAGRTPDESALLITAPSGDPFDDAELYRVASLVRRYGSHPLVEVAFSGGDPDPIAGVRRCRLLGAARVVLLPAAFARPEVPDVPGTQVEGAGPLVSPAAVARVLAERVQDARRRWRERGDDGIAAGLTAADDHGHSHTHPPGEGHDHGRGHGPLHPHQHQHPHPHPHAGGAGRMIRSTA